MTRTQKPQGEQGKDGREKRGRMRRLGAGALRAEWVLVLAWCFVTVSSGRAAPQTLPDATKGPPALPPSTGNVTSARLLAPGLPLGGLGTAPYALNADGSVSLTGRRIGAAVQQSASTSNSAASLPTPLPGAFGAVWVQAGSGVPQAITLTTTNRYGLPGVGTLHFDGLFPQATLTYPQARLPVAVSTLVFSSLIPSDLKNSTLPGLVWLFRVKNTTQTPLNVSVALAWQGQTGAKSAALASESGFYGVQLVGPEAGAVTLLTEPPRRQSTVTQTGWNPQDARPGWWETFAASGAVTPEASTSTEAAGEAAVLAVKLTLRPGELVEVPFTVAWHERPGPQPAPVVAPVRGEPTAQINPLPALPYYAGVFANDTQVARYLLTEWRTLYALVEEWQARLTSSSLPRPLVQAVAASNAPLFDTVSLDWNGGIPRLQLAADADPQRVQWAAQAVALFFPALTITPSAPGSTGSVRPPLYTREGMPRTELHFDESDWQTLVVLEGFAYDPASGELTLTPNLPGTWRTLTAPIFAPGFWARLEYRPEARGETLSFRLDRLLATQGRGLQAIQALSSGGQTLTIRTLRVPGPPAISSLPKSGVAAKPTEESALAALPQVFVSVGPRSLGAKIARLAPSGDLQITLDTPLLLTTGDRVEVTVRAPLPASTK